MLKWAIISFLISIVAGVLGFTNIAAGARTIAKWLFVIAIILLILFIILSFTAGELVL